MKWSHLEAVKFNYHKKENQGSCGRQNRDLDLGRSGAQASDRGARQTRRPIRKLHRPQSDRAVPRNSESGGGVIHMDLAPKLLYTRPEAADMLSISVSSLDVLIGRGMLRAVRKGRRVLVHKTELERLARQNIPTIWPAKEHGKTVNRAEAHS
jgi:excisionase family DNA binding protein